MADLVVMCELLELYLAEVLVVEGDFIASHHADTGELHHFQQL